METYPAAYYPEEGVLSGGEDRIDPENSGDVYLTLWSDAACTRKLPRIWAS